LTIYYFSAILGCYIEERIGLSKVYKVLYNKGENAMSKITKKQKQRLKEGSGGNNPRYTKETFEAYLDKPWSTLTQSIYNSLIIDYSEFLTTMISAGHYDWVSPNITSENFPLDEKGKVEVDAEIIHFDRRISSDDAIAELVQRALRPATLAELLALGAKHPDVQRQFRVIALGSIWCGSGGCFVPCLYRYGSKRHLVIEWFKDDWGWGVDDRFLAVGNK